MWIVQWYNNYREKFNSEGEKVILSQKPRQLLWIFAKGNSQGYSQKKDEARWKKSETASNEE